MLLLLTLVVSCSLDQQTEPPGSLSIPEHPSIPSERERFGIVIPDEYAWMNATGTEAVRAAVVRETQYASTVLTPLAPLASHLQQEMNSRLPVTTSTSVVVDDMVYEREIRPGYQYAFHTRHRLPGGDKEFLVDENTRASGHDYYHLRNWSLDPSGTRLVLAEYVTGDEHYRLAFLNVNGTASCCDISNTNGDMVWGAQGRRLYFIARDPVTTRPATVMVREDDQVHVLYTEKDPRFALSLRESRSKRYILVNATSSGGNRILKIDRKLPTGPVEVLGWEEGTFHQLVHIENAEDLGQFYRLTTSPGGVGLFRADARGNWHHALPEALRGGPTPIDFEVYPDHLALHYRHRAKEYLKLVDRLTDAVEDVPVVVPLQTLQLRRSSQLMETSLSGEPGGTLGYELRHPLASAIRMHYNVATGSQSASVSHRRGLETLRNTYHGEVKQIAARDGTLVPVSLLYRSDRFLRRRSPLLVNVYGAYGAPLNKGYRVGWQGLLDRGFVIAMAHVRGGGADNGDWHRKGSGARKDVAISDFLDVIHGLVIQGYGDPGRVFAQGTSAAGVIIGASINIEPDLFAGIVLTRPFVDVANTLMDENRPLTLGEYGEWGDPRTLEGLRRILSYSPYDNIRSALLPSMLIRSSASDQRVQTSEHLRWVARLRDHNMADSSILLTIDQAGHRGVSDRHDRYHQLAEAHAFLLSIADQNR